MSRRARRELAAVLGMLPTPARLLGQLDSRLRLVYYLSKKRVEEWRAIAAASTPILERLGWRPRLERGRRLVLRPIPARRRLK